ncbi:MAG: transposase [Janthinobacterium sp.]|uniref:Transposase n=1 Tax=Janthinobacterium violaceinigrum TaxID=2654252 RepID=A0A6I1HUM2_9BURK|nr:transposase [Janthinobacterium sp.]KAB8061530.1 transposase [Janthinobacterium violaceinigrum]MCX7290470.1 transposase [Janthinobacterium sp.]
MGRQTAACLQVARRLRLHADAVLRFITEHVVLFTNNLVERTVRMPKV